MCTLVCTLNISSPDQIRKFRETSQASAGQFSACMQSGRVSPKFRFWSGDEISWMPTLNVILEALWAPYQEMDVIFGLNIKFWRGRRQNKEINIFKGAWHKITRWHNLLYTPPTFVRPDIIRFTLNSFYSDVTLTSYHGIGLVDTHMTANHGGNWQIVPS